MVVVVDKERVGKEERGRKRDDEGSSRLMGIDSILLSAVLRTRYTDNSIYR